MTQQEYEYRKLINLIAFSMLIFCGAFFVIGIILGIVPLLLTRLTGEAGEIAYQLIYALLYAVAFLAPVLFFCLMRRRTHTSHPIYFQFKMGKGSVAYLFVGLAVINAAAMLNSSIVGLLPFGGTSTLEELIVPATTNVQLVLQFIVIAIVPAFVEELLFRGVILTNLLPYGKTAAVLGSALLFGVMHQNFEQLLYATVAGLVMGYIYVTVKSIWPCVMLHLANNALSVIQGALFERLPEAEGMAVYTVMQVVIYVLGVLFAVVLILKGEGERGGDEDSGVLAAQISLRRRIRLFFSPAMIAFFAVALTEALLTVLLISFL